MTRTLVTRIFFLTMALFAFCWNARAQDSELGPQGLDVGVIRQYQGERTLARIDESDGIIVEEIKVNAGETVETLLRRKGIRPDPMSFGIVSDLNPELPSINALRVGQELRIVSSRPYNPDDPPMVLVGGMSNRERIEINDQQLRRTIDGMHAERWEELGTTKSEVESLLDEIRHIEYYGVPQNSLATSGPNVKTEQTIWDGTRSCGHQVRRVITEQLVQVLPDGSDEQYSRIDKMFHLIKGSEERPPETATIFVTAWSEDQDVLWGYEVAYETKSGNISGTFASYTPSVEVINIANWIIWIRHASDNGWQSSRRNLSARTLRNNRDICLDFMVSE